MTDTQRTATEQLLISNAIDQAVARLDFAHLKGRTIFLDGQYLEGAVDRGYLISSLRQQLLASGCILQEDRAKARYVIEVRSGGIGTDRHSLLIGVPQMTVPSLVPGQPSQIPEIPFAKKNDEIGIAKIALFAYNRESGQRLWQSGLVESASRAKDLWVIGLGPFREGTILKGTEFAGEEIPLPQLGDKDLPNAGCKSVVPVQSAAAWGETEKAKQAALSPALETLVRLALGGSSLLNKAATPDTKAEVKKAEVPAKPLTLTPTLPTTPTSSPNAGGQAETAPSSIRLSGGLGTITGG